LAFSRISWNCFCIEKVMDRVYGSQDHAWLSVYGGFTTIDQCGRSGAREVIVIAWREREEVVGVLTNGATLRWSYGDGHTIVLNKVSRWCSDDEMVPDTRRRGWSWGGRWIMRVLSSYILYGRRATEGNSQGEEDNGGETSIAPVTGDENGK
jgi:hypothetical protein